MPLRFTKIGFKREVPNFALTGNCRVREHTGDGAYVGLCYFATYEGYCPRHGDVRAFVNEDADLTGADDRLLPPHGQRDYGPPELERFLHGDR